MGHFNFSATLRLPLLAVLAWLFLLPNPTEAQVFTVRRIEIQGIERISEGTVLNYLPVREGESLQAEDAGAAIKALYGTDLFSDVSLSRRGDVLIVTLAERPAIADIDITGNKLISDEDLETSLKDVEIARGRVFNRSLLEKVEQELRRLYFSEGNYGMSIDTKVVPLERNRVSVKIDIVEGESARIRQISILGNRLFDDDQLLDLMESGIPSPFAVFSSADEYSRAKLAGDLESIRSFYQDRGHIRFAINSTQVSITPDKEDIYITVNLSEGEKYSVRNLRLAGKFVVPEKELRSLINMSTDDVFSRKVMTASTSRLTARLEEEGYAFANVNVVPEIDDQSRQVDLTFFVDPGKRVYVRRINFAGNTKTHDKVFRREMRQFEGGWYSPRKVDRSRVRIQRLSYIERVSVETPTVPGTDDMVDVKFNVVERPAGSFGIGAGFSSSQGLLFNINLTQENLFGTGNRLQLAFDNSSTNRQLSISHTNPYYTDDGVSRTFSIFARETDTSNLSDTSDYFADSYGASVRYGIPLSEFGTLRLGAGAEGTDVETTDGTPDHINEFVDQFGNRYWIFQLTGSYTHDTRNRTVFAERGAKHQISAELPIPGGDLEYFRLGYDYEVYYPVTERTVFSLSTEIDYGDGYGDFDELPFFKKYFAGGVRSVRGYDAFSLGPRDSNDNARGGDFKTTGTAEIIFPPPLNTESGSTRFSLFLDFGNVFADVNDFDESELRTSAGVSFIWLSPVGPLTFSLAEALNAKSGDDPESFQFTIGALF